MPASEEGRISSRKPLVVVWVIIALFFGLLNFWRVAQSPQFESYRTLHVIQLVVSGACFGAALAISIFTILRPRN